MTPLPALDNGELIVWRLDRDRHASSWDSGEGAFQVGGRWNSKGIRAVYCALDPATAILEVAVHKGFDTLDTVPHTLSEIRITDPASIRIVGPADVPNPHWLSPGAVSAGQRRFGDQLLADHKFILVPSVVSGRSWNLVFVAANAPNAYGLKSQERFALDPRLNPFP